MMLLTSVLMIGCLALSLSAVVWFSYEIRKRRHGPTEIRCPTDRVDPGMSHGNVEPFE